MSRSLQKLPGEPIILETLHPDDSMAELGAGQSESQALMDAQLLPVTWIVDLREAPAVFTQRFLPMISQMFKKVPPHPKPRQIAYVLPPDCVPSDFPIPVFDTLDVALKYAHSE